MRRHPEAHELALYVSRDLSVWRNFAVGRHLSACGSCRREIGLLANASSAFATEVELIPGGAAGWDRLASEMRANIRLGLEAGECVGDVSHLEREMGDEQPAGWYAGWNPGRWWNSSRLGEWLHLDANWVRVVSASTAVVLVSAGIWWWQHEEIAPMSSYFRSEPVVASVEESAPEGDVVFRTVTDGLQVERGGRSLTLAHTGRAATALTVSLNGSMTAKYVDDDTGQVTIHHVYAE
jgi:hypothetical protein